MDNLVDLRGFRIRNRIKQGELAEFLGTSPAFISMVENGQNKLPETKIKKILTEGAIQKPWDVYCLIPAFNRILQLHKYLKKEYNLQYLPPENSPLYLSEQIVTSICYGRIGISEDIATYIVERLKELTLVNKQWLMTGEGDMVILPAVDEQSTAELRKRIKILEEKYDTLLNRVKLLESHLDVKKK